MKDEAPTSTVDLLEKAEAVLRDKGVIVFSTPTPGVRLANSKNSAAIKDWLEDRRRDSAR